MKVQVHILSHHEVGVIDMYVLQPGENPANVTVHFNKDRGFGMDEGYEIDVIEQTLEKQA